MDWKGALQIVGKQLCTDASDEAARKLIMKKVEESVLMIDKLLLGGAQKLRILDAVMMSMLSWEHVRLICKRAWGNSD